MSTYDLFLITLTALIAAFSALLNTPFQGRIERAGTQSRATLTSTMETESSRPWLGGLSFRTKLTSDSKGP